MIECEECHTKVSSEDLEKYHWIIVGDKYFCPHCDVTIKDNK